MKWYGFKHNIKNSFIKNKNNNFKQKNKKNCIILKKRINFSFYKLNLYFPARWDFLILKKIKIKNIIYVYLYSTNYFFLLPILKKFLSFRYDSQVNCLILNFFLNNNFYRIFWNYFKLIFYSFSKIFFKKLKFKGKGYYIYKNNRNTIALQFGYSHLMYLYSFFITVKFLTKTTILMFGINKNDLTSNSKKLYYIKPINIFTGKGIRFARQIIYKKTGKVSSYR